VQEEDMRTLSVCVLAAALALGSTGCVFEDGEHGCYAEDCGSLPGDIGFYWAFALPGGGSTDNCMQADVARMDVRVWDAWGEELEFEILDRPCTDQGALLTDFWPGDYTLELAATCRLGGEGFTGWFELQVFEGPNEFGTLVLDPSGGCL
jgi:hypothetical protein